MIKIKTYQDLIASGFLESDDQEDGILVQIRDIAGDEWEFIFPRNTDPIKVAIARILLGDDDWWGACEIALDQGADPERLLDAALEHLGEYIADTFFDCISARTDA